MKRLRDILQLPEIHVSLFCLTFLLLGWPLLIATVRDYDVAIFIYLFLVWGVSIAVLVLIARSLNPHPRTEKRERDC